MGYDPGLLTSLRHKANQIRQESIRMNAAAVAGSGQNQTVHLAEALQYRSKLILS